MDNPISFVFLNHSTTKTVYEMKLGSITNPTMNLPASRK